MLGAVGLRGVASEDAGAEVLLPVPPTRVALANWGRAAEVRRLAVARAAISDDPAIAADRAAGLVRDAVHADVRAAAVALLVEADTTDWPDDYRGAFLRELAPDAILSARAHGIPVSITLAQAILESGWGRSNLAVNHNNLFGVKAGRSDDAVATTTRERGGRWRRARFRTYERLGDSLAHHDALLGQDARYAAAREHVSDWRAFLRALAPVYATSRSYVSQVSWFVERYELDRWDALVVPSSAEDGVIVADAGGGADDAI